LSTPSEPLVEGIAVIGTVGRFPGASDLAQFWANLCAGVESVSVLSDAQLTGSGFDPRQLRADPRYVPVRGIVERAEWFDASFFGFTPREAQLTDPQHRLFLEAAWEALETAGYDPARTKGTVGIFAGCGNNTWARRYFMRDLDELESGEWLEAAIGNEKDYVATRVAYKLNLRGPAVSVNTACSTSLVTVCQACQALWTYQCDVALAGGVNVTFPQARGYYHDDDGISSPDGHTRAFDADARGTVFSNGLGVVVLKRLAEALEDGDQILAVIRGAAINNDGGGKASFTAPSAEGQAEVIALAQAMAGISSDTVTYVETHGTATPIGDVIELAGLRKAFRQGSTRTQHCAIGSVKTNIGHVEHAAGVAGLIKTILALHHRQIPPSLHYKRPNPKLELAASPFFVNDSLREWSATDSPRRAGVSSFGVGGTNAHVVLEEAPRRPSSGPSGMWHVLPLSAKTGAALDGASRALADFLRRHLEVPLADVAFTLQRGRSAFDFRRAVVAQHAMDAGAILTGEHSVKGIGPERATDRQVVFMFPGGGAQYCGAARGLCLQLPEFKQHVDACLRALDPKTAATVTRLIHLASDQVTDADRDLAERPSVGLPMLFAIEFATAQYWIARGVTPTALIGHSLGEYAAACVAGVMSVDDAVALVQRRGQLFDELPAGAMLSIAAPVDRVTPYLNHEFDVAVINGPTSCVVSGRADKIGELAERLERDGFETVRLHIAVAAHSSLVEPILPAFRSFVAGLRLRAPQIPIVSNVTGTWLTDSQAVNPDYWIDHLRHTVRFSEGLQCLFKRPNAVILEVGPGRVLSTITRAHPDRPSSTVAIESMRHPQDSRDDYEVLLTAQARLWVSGAAVSWDQEYRDEIRRRVALPTYPFERQYFGPVEQRPVAVAELNPVMTEPPVPGHAPISQQSGAPVLTRDRQSRILDELTAIMQRLSGVEPSALDPDTTFLDLGFESLLLGQVSLAINRTFGVRVKFRHFFEETPTLQRLARYLDQQLPADKFAPPAVETTTAVSPAARLAPTPAMPGLPVPTGGTTSLPGTSLVEAVINQQLDLMRQQIAALSGISALAPLVPSADPGVTAPPPLAVAVAKEKSSDRPSTLKLFGGVSRGALDGRWLPVPKGPDGGLTSHQREHLDVLTERYTEKTKSSKALANQARTHLVDPRAVAGFGPMWKELVYQIASDGSSGSKLWDVDGNEYVDVTMGFGSALFGHAPKFMTDVMDAQLKRGYEVGLHSPLAGQVAALFCEITGSDRVCFCTSGTDAVIGALRAARAVTGKDRIATFIGDIHGRLDEVLGRPAVSARGRGSMPLAAGIPEHIVGPVLTLEYGVPDSLEVVRAHASELAAVLVEPVRTRQPDLQPVDFLRELRRLTQEHAIALVMDEVVTGFRVSPGGAQQHFGITGDLATWGKAAAGGMPIGMISGRAEYMNVLDGGVWRYGDASGPETPMTNFGGSGTFGKHPLSMVATLACLQHLKEAGPKLQQDLNARTTAFVARLNSMFKRERLPVHLEHFSSFFLPRVLGDRRFEALLFHHLRDRGVHIYLDYPCFLSTAHSDADVDFLVDAFLQSARALRDGGCLSEPEREASSREDERVRSAEPERASSAAAVRTVADRGGARDQTAVAPGQLEIWLAAMRSDEANAAFNQVLQIRLNGPLDADALRWSVDQLLARHDALRSVFSADGQSFHVAAATSVSLAVEDLAALDERTRTDRLAEALDQEAATPFPLDRELVRTRLIKLGADCHVLLFSAHHIICDGWSLGMVAKDLGILYAAAAENAPLAFDAHMQYREFIAQRDPEEAHEAEAYWLSLFSDGGPVLHLPTDRPRPSVKTYSSRMHRLALDKTTLEAVRHAASAQHCTLFHFLIAAYGILLHRLSRQDDVVIGVAAAGQAATGCDDLIGHCVSLLPTRSRLPADATIGDYITLTKRSLIDAYDHQQVTFSSLLPRLKLIRDASRLPLVSALLTHETETIGVQFGTLACAIEQVPRRAAIFDIELYAIEQADQLLLSLWLNADLFDEATGVRWLGHYATILSGLQNTGELVRQVPMTSADERALLESWNKQPIKRAGRRSASP
jgi:acyl transferase domain-containing protein/glutamate-1-semialdehyde aminotransferase